MVRTPRVATFQVQDLCRLARPGLEVRASPVTVVQLSRRLRRLAPRIAVCAMPGPLDLLMVTALRRIGVPVAVVVHDAQAHPGDDFPMLFALQRALLRRVSLA